MELKEMTLDEASDAFEALPSTRTAANFLRALLEYVSDDMITDDEFLNGVASVAQYLEGNPEGE